MLRVAELIRHACAEVLSRGEIARKVNLKFAPDIRFKVDDSFDNAAKIDALLNSDKVRRDLDAQAEDEPGGDKGEAE